MKIKSIFLTAILSCVSLVACGGAGKNGEQSGEESSVASASAPVATFSADSAYHFVEAQCAFGARVPGTEAHERCAEWLAERLRLYCDTLYVQRGAVTTFDNKTLNITNLIGSFNLDAPYRLLLVAHWDCRPWADNDADRAKRNQPVMGANDAASGVAVLLELARGLSSARPDAGVDILLVDAEDWGETDGDEDSWALGTQYWANNPHRPGYKALGGILLDMVGAEGAQFRQEYFSLQYAGRMVDDVWRTAEREGHGAYFSKAPGGAITDDHVTINRVAGIPCIDIIDTRQGSDTGFFPWWHTTGDTIDKIDKTTLKAVGETLARFVANY